MWLDIRIALSSLATHKLRAVLAMLGVFLGALAFTGVQQVSQIMVRNAEIETEKLGPNLFAVMSGQVRFLRGGGVMWSGFARTFTLSDALALRDGIPEVVQAAPVNTVEMPIRFGKNAVKCTLTATWPEYVEVRSHRVELGRFFTRQEVEGLDKVCCLGRKIAERLFGDPESALGQTVLVYRANFQVVGVMEAKGRDLSGADQDEQVYVPLSTFVRRAANQRWIGGVFLRLAPGADQARVREAAGAIMRERHHIKPGQKDDFSLLSAEDTMALQRQALDLMHTLGAIASLVSFAVGGLGILSIMVLMVRARRVEIGVRRAVGGRRRDIVRQFLFEAGLMSGTGGALGVLASVALVVCLSLFARLPLVVDATVLALTLAGSCALGVGAGAYPAWQASRVEILDVLKS
jgi:putative ABC transport system permease protein